MKTPQPLEVMKREDGDYAVRWNHKPKKWAIIKKENEVMFDYIVWWILNK